VCLLRAIDARQRESHARSSRPRARRSSGPDARTGTHHVVHRPDGLAADGGHRLGRVQAHRQTRRQARAAGHSHDVDVPDLPPGVGQRLEHDIGQPRRVTLRRDVWHDAAERLVVRALPGNHAGQDLAARPEGAEKSVAVRLNLSPTIKVRIVSRRPRCG
jgi:hypothetical protein